MGRPLEGASAILLSDGIQRKANRVPVAKLIAPTSLVMLVRRGEVDRPFPSPRTHAMLSPRIRNLCPKFPWHRVMCRTAHEMPRPSKRVMCSASWMPPACKTIQSSGCKISDGTSSRRRWSFARKGAMSSMNLRGGRLVLYPKARARAPMDSLAANLQRSEQRPMAATAS